MSPTRDSYVYNLNTDTTLDMILPTITACSGNVYTYSMNTPTFANLTSLSTWFVYTASPTPKITVTIAATNNDLAGKYLFKLQYYLNGNYINELIRLVVIPVTSATFKPTAPNHDISQCNSKIYPFQYGFEYPA